MSAVRDLIKGVVNSFGYKIEKIDPLEELLPKNYNLSPFLPRVYRKALYRLLYFKEMIDSVAKVHGDVVECGVSIGHGTLVLHLLSEYAQVSRKYFGFDSFDGFPDPVAADGVTPITGRDFLATPPEIVQRVLRDGGIPDGEIRANITLVKGWFKDTVPNYHGKIALLHLDGDLYESYIEPLRYLYDKVQPGGVIMFDEYRDERWQGATRAIDEFFGDKPEKPVAHSKCNWKYFVRKSGGGEISEAM